MSFQPAADSKITIAVHSLANALVVILNGSAFTHVSYVNIWLYIHPVTRGKYPWVSHARNRSVQEL